MKTAPLLNKYYWNEGSGNKNFKSAARLLNRVYVLWQGLDLSKVVLWVSVSQREAELSAIKVGGLKKILPNGVGKADSTLAARQKFFLTFNFDSW